MDIKAVINEKYKETEIHVCKDELTDEVKNLVRDISNFVNQDITVKDEDLEKVLIHQREIIYLYAENTKVYVRTLGGEYEAVNKLYELEEKLDQKIFFRISKSQIVNLKKIKKLDLSMTGTIKVIMTDGSECYTSRRQVVALKKVLGV